MANSKLKVTELYGRVMEETLYDNTMCDLFGEVYDEWPQIIPIMNPGVLIHKPGDYKPFYSYMQLAATIFKGGEAADTGVTTWAGKSMSVRLTQLDQALQT